MSSENQIAALTTPPPFELTDSERREFNAARARLARGRGVVIRAADMVATGLGSAASLGLRQLRVSPGLEQRMQGLAQALLGRAYDIAILGLNRPFTPAEQRRLAAGVMASGALGGAAGMAGFVPDASVTTLAILRAIASEALAQGEELKDDFTRAACLEVFVLQNDQQLSDQSQPIGSTPRDLQPESAFSYHTARLLLNGRPLSLLLSEAAARYGLTLSQKFVAQSVPFLGAAAGAALNSAFLAHYRDLARAHFILRRIERQHGIVHEGVP